MVPGLPARQGHFPSGRTVTEVAAGKQALDALEQGRFDAIVTDARVPRLAGIELVCPLPRVRQLYSGNYFRQRLCRSNASRRL